VLRDERSDPSAAGNGDINGVSGGVSCSGKNAGGSGREAARLLLRERSQEKVVSVERVESERGEQVG
jgi:hypothetical protein